MLKKTLVAIFIIGVIVAVFLTALYIGKRWKKGVDYPSDYQELVLQNAAEFGLSPALVHAVMLAESHCRAGALSPRGAVGLMQLMPATAEEVARNLGDDFDIDALPQPEINIRLGCAYLAYLEGIFTDRRTVAAAYNAGLGRVRGWITEQGGQPGQDPVGEIPFPETRGYVKRVEDAYEVYAGRYGVENAR